VVADAWQYRHHDLDGLYSVIDPVGATVDCIFGLDVQSLQVIDDPEHRLAGSCFQPVEAGLQQRDVAAKAIDDKTDDSILLRL